MPPKKKSTKKPKKAPRLIDLDNAEARDAWKKLAQEKAIEEQTSKNKANQQKLDLAYGDHPELEATELNTVSDKELKNDWEQIRRIAMVKFPEGARHSSLSPQNRLAAVAYSLGWETSKIAKASGINKNTLYAWFNRRPDIRLFIEEFNMKIGQEDVLGKFGALEYKGVRVVEEIMENPEVSASTRLDAVKWIFERKRGKPGQVITHKGNMLRDLIEMLQSGEMSEELTPEEENRLFPDKKETTH